MNSPIASNNLAPSSVQLGSFCLANAQIVLEDHVITGALWVQDGIIAKIEETSDVPDGAIDCAGDYLIPGLIELHTDNLERHIQPRPSVDWPHDAAILAHDAELASVGITTVFDAMRVGSIPTGKGGYIKYARQLSKELWQLREKNVLKISHFLHLRAEVCSETLAEELSEFDETDRVGIVSLMDHTPGQRQFRDISKLKTYVASKRGMNDAEFDEHVQKLLKLRETYGELHEAKTVSEARRFGAVLASHDDTTTEQVEVSSGHGIHLAEFPTTVEAAGACRANDIAIMMGAPNIIRGGSHSGNVSALDLADRNLLDIISSDYVPAALLLSAFRLAERWDDLPRAVRTVTANPADATGLKDRGRLAQGLRADIVRVSALGSTPVVRGVWSQARQVG
ncbi:alpha-D-ribose 1-methylphosphonate 5-triphosphate diphosphatase [Cognatishimia activa]|uniref:Alpha-D-ribose 1-methylphosphonate 5-triphosphate diphosphatase n=1 Tax=Cognatishimia activa TaxID=1715691 RepID=A0A0P1IY05_9RHOB|nr:alpha-D-ribose 1-methylphosphonate 5-triphosphate diphosphatase [Cognatishimia activa]CUI75913.1 Alpha-D-ribose 1-methylphosphonate 5-triphosphate diphosphatase [Cognatishimia activa]CUK26723.1 Alpha-D-ribose 1-methylphosphonate 5-triphosphate diphosphatase [Cognatishimia activa]